MKPTLDIKLVIVIAFLILSKDLAWAEKGFIVRTSADAGYDSNIRYTNDNEIGSFITRTTLGFQYYLEEKTQSLDLLAQLHHQYYFDHTEFNNFSQDIGVFFKKETSEFHTFGIEDTFTHDEDATTFEDEFGRESGRFDTYINDFSYIDSRQLTPENLLRISYSNEIKEVDHPDLLDSIDNNINFEINQVWSPKTEVFLTYDFVHSYIDLPDHAFLHILAPGLKRHLTPKLLLKTYAGANIVQTYDDENLIRPAYYAAVTYDVDETSAYTLSYKKAHVTTGYIDDVFDQWRISLEFKKELSKRLSGYISTFMGEGEFVRRDISDEFSALGFGLSYLLNRNLKANLSYHLSNKNSNVAEREYTKSTIFLGFTLGF
jgi:hypothetical protein